MINQWLVLTAVILAVITMGACQLTPEDQAIAEQAISIAQAHHDELVAEYPQCATGYHQRLTVDPAQQARDLVSALVSVRNCAGLDVAGDSFTLKEWDSLLEAAAIRTVDLVAEHRTARWETAHTCSSRFMIPDQMSAREDYEMLLIAGTQRMRECQAELDDSLPDPDTKPAIGPALEKYLRIGECISVLPRTTSWELYDMWHNGNAPRHIIPYAKMAYLSCYDCDGSPLWDGAYYEDELESVHKYHVAEDCMAVDKNR